MKREGVVEILIAAAIGFGLTFLMRTLGYGVGPSWLIGAIFALVLAFLYRKVRV